MGEGGGTGESTSTFGNKRPLQVFHSKVLFIETLRRLMLLTPPAYTEPEHSRFGDYCPPKCTRVQIAFQIWRSVGHLEKHLSSRLSTHQVPTQNRITYPCSFRQGGTPVTPWPAVWGSIPKLHENAAARLQLRSHLGAVPGRAAWHDPFQALTIAAHCPTRSGAAIFKSQRLRLKIRCGVIIDESLRLKSHLIQFY